MLLYASAKCHAVLADVFLTVWHMLLLSVDVLGMSLTLAAEVLCLSMVPVLAVQELYIYVMFDCLLGVDSGLQSTTLHPSHCVTIVRAVCQSELYVISQSLYRWDFNRLYAMGCLATLMCVLLRQL